jgi:hypothetical protein
LRAGDSTPPPSPDTAAAVDSTPAPGNLKTSYEFDADTSFVGDARTNFGSGSAGDVSEQRTDARFVIAPQYNDGPIYRFGLAYERYGFGFSKAAPLPDILQAENLVLGVDFELFNSWLVRVEADPGLYGDSRSAGFRDFNVPFTLGGSYIASEEVQWILGVGVDFNRQIPAIPAIGVRWALSDDWVLDAILPTPRLEYDWSKALTLYLGSDIDDGTYRVDNGLGVALHRPKLSGAIVEYDEIRLGAGFSWKASKAITFELEGGYLPYREFDYHRADTHFSNDNGAAYGQMSINAQF